MIRFEQEEFEALIRYMEDKYGIDLRKKQILAECRLNSEIEKSRCGSLREFLNKMKADRTGRTEAILVNRLTTNYTYFMREQKHFEYLEQKILPELSRDRNRGPFRIWCAGCSSGQECYTLSMLLHDYKDSGKWLPEFEILGTDISETVLRQAVEGRYQERELEHIPEEWRRRYCQMDAEEGSFMIRPAVRAEVSFRKMNLLKPFVGRNTYDLVSCRNVMIYFREDARRALLDILYDSLKPGGYLFVGHTELLPKKHERFHYICPAIYRK